jgi:hypothetical protein
LVPSSEAIDGSATPFVVCAEPFEVPPVAAEPFGAVVAGAAPAWVGGVAAADGAVCGDPELVLAGVAGGV